METITQEYIEEKTDEIVNEMVKRKVSLKTITTSSKWDQEFHELMPEISDTLINRGFSVNKRIRRDMTEWTIILTI